MGLNTLMMFLIKCCTQTDIWRQRLGSPLRTQRSCSPFRCRCNERESAAPARWSDAANRHTNRTFNIVKNCSITETSFYSVMSHNRSRYLILIQCYDKVSVAMGTQRMENVQVRTFYETMSNLASLWGHFAGKKQSL